MIDDTRYIPVVSMFCYLGSLLCSDTSDDMDVNSRILKAANAFGAIRKQVFSSTQIANDVKGRVYKSVILPILLYGAECWCLTEKLLHQLRTFHNRCVRSMCRVNLYHTRVWHVSTQELLTRLGLEPIDTYVCREQLRWAGHVMRMPWSRLPRKMMSCWVGAKRPRGCPRMTYGRSLYKNLRKAGVDEHVWHEIALDRASWKELISNISFIN